MEELAKKFAEYLGDPYVAAVGYGALAYGFFHWLDEKASDEAKAALARTMRLKDYKSEQVASALVEVFDRIYTHPLLSWRAFLRSLLFTAVVSVFWVFEELDFVQFFPGWDIFLFGSLFYGFLFNVFTDYLALLLIRPMLIRSGTKPVISLALSAVSGAAIVLAANALRIVTFSLVYSPPWMSFFSPAARIARHISRAVPTHWDRPPLFLLPALAVFAWLLLFALGIVIARLLTPLSGIVGRAQWFLKEGKEHPLKAIGYVAAVVVFLGTVAGRAVLKALAS